MKPFIVILVILILAALVPVAAQVQTFTGVNGLGHSTLTCKDRDGDGYGVGPLVSVNTTVSASIAAGTQTITPASMTGISTGSVLRVDHISNMERVLVTATTGSTFTGVFLIAHAGGVTVTDQGCLGPDADDNDPLVWTAAQAITKYGSIAGLLTKIGNDIILDNPIPNGSAAAIAAGYASPHATWYLAPASASPTGSDSNACNTASVPCLTFARLAAQGYTTSDLVLLRDAWNGVCSPHPGTSAKYSVVMAYPGEQPRLAGGPNNCNMVGTASVPYDYIVIDGLGVGTSSSIGGGTQDVGSTGSSDLHDILLRNIEGSGATGISYISFFNALSNLTIEYSVLHDNNCAGGGCQHGTYNGSRMLASDHVTYRRNISYRNGTNGLTFNGRCTGCVFDQNIAYSNGVSGLTLEMGVSSSFVRSNLLFSNANGGLTIFNYPGDCATQGGSTGNAQICPFDQTGNLIQNNTILQTGNANNPNANSSPGSCPGGISYCTQAGININNTTSPLAGNIGGNTYRNNLISSYGYTGHYPPVVYGDPVSSGACDSTCTGWVGADIWDHNDFFYTDGTTSNTTISFGAGIGFGFHGYTCAAATAVTTMTNCLNVQPGFISRGISQWNSETAFDLRLLPSAAALHAGGTTAIPAYDLVGRAFLDDTPAIGALERNLYVAGWNDLGSATAVVSPANGAPGFTNNITFGGTGGTCTSGNQTFCYPFATEGTNAFKTWSDAVLRETPGKTHMLVAADNGGHSDYIDNEVNSWTYNTASPAWSRLSGPSTFIGDPGTGATFSEAVSGGALTSCTVTAAGSGYIGDGAIVWIPNSADTVTAPAQAIYTQSSGGVTACYIKSNGAGAGYAHAPTGVTPVLNTPALAYGNTWGLAGTSGSGAPSGSCASSTSYIDTTAQMEYVCVSSAWIGPTPIYTVALPEYADATPSSRHMTGLQSYSPVEDRMVQFNGGLAGGNGPHFQDMWALNFGTYGWQRLDPTSCGAGCSLVVGQPNQWTHFVFSGFSGTSIWNPIGDTHFFYVDDSGGLMFLYKPSNNQTLYAGVGGIDPDGAATTNGFGRDIIPDRQLAYYVGAHFGLTYQASKVDLTKIPSPGGSSAETVITSSISVSGGTSCAGWWKASNGSGQYYAPGLAWNQAIGKFVAFIADGSGTYYTMDPDALTCSTNTLTGGPGATDSPWLFGKFRYSPAVDAHVVFQGFNTGGSTSQHAFVLSLNAPDPTSSPAPASSSGGSVTNNSGVMSGNSVKQ